MNTIEYTNGSLLFKKKDEATNFYVLKSGEVELFDPDENKVLAVLKPGASFGEQAILAGGVRSVSAKAKGDVVCMEISADALKNMLENSPGTIKPVFEALLLQLYMHNDLRSKGYLYNDN
ncbi:MAG: cyclic nucleotide-binding domain-containing protein [Burkholderiaceae bacterium]